MDNTVYWFSIPVGGRFSSNKEHVVPSPEYVFCTRLTTDTFILDNEKLQKTFSKTLFIKWQNV